MTLCVTAVFPAEVPAKHQTAQDCGVPEVSQATHSVLKLQVSPAWPTACAPVGSKAFAASSAAAALPAALQSKKVCPCPLSCWIWQPVPQHALPAAQQVPPHVRPLVQAQAPPVHACPVGHFFPQAPQLAALVCVSTQTPRQTVFPAGQAQLPPVQTWAPVQAWPQAPQFALSV